MANSEDYLDGLLNSVNTVRSDVKKAEEIAEESRKQREERLNSRISPRDDFMAASGLNDYRPEPTSHSHLRKAFSEEEFLREFEADLEVEDEDVDAFLRDFEEEIKQEEMAFESDDEPSFLDNIEEIVNQAKEQIEQGEVPDLPMDDQLDEEEPEEISEDMKEEMPQDIEEEMPAIDDVQMEELDMTLDMAAEEGMGEDSDDEDDDLPDIGGFDEELPEEPVADEILDEDTSDMDLMDLLSGDTDLGDIGALLQADEENIDLEESQEEFELQAESVQGGDSLLEAESNHDEEATKKPGFLSNLLSIFSKKSKDDKGEDKEVIDITSEGADDVSQENLDILKSLDEAEEAAPKKEKKKKEKKKKEPKEKKVREPKEKKPKKEREPDNSPKIPGKIIFVFVVLSVSVVVLITLGQTILGYKLSLSNARVAYNAGDYFLSYEQLMGVTLKEQDEDLFRKSRLLGDLQKRSREHHILMTNEKYAMALDSLVIGVARYDEYYQEAKDLGIEKEYKEIGDGLIQLLSDQFGVSREDAVAIYKLNREDYSIRLDQIIEECNL